MEILLSFLGGVVLVALIAFFVARSIVKSRVAQAGEAAKLQAEAALKAEQARLESDLEHSASRIEELSAKLQETKDEAARQLDEAKSEADRQLKEAKGEAERQLREAKSEAEKQQHIDDIKDKCPFCGSELVLRRGKYGQFWGCSTYPKCKFTRPLK